MRAIAHLEKLVMEMLLAGEAEPLAVLREQFKMATVSSREMTGVGFFTHFALPADAPQLVGKRSFELTDVAGVAKGVQNGMGFVLFVRGGVLDFLEGFTYGEPWPEEIRDPAVTYSVQSKGIMSVRSPDDTRDMRAVRRIVQPLRYSSGKETVTAHADLQFLYDRLLPFAEQTLGMHRAFSPFGASTGSDGKVTHSKGPGSKESSGDAVLIDLLTVGFRAKAKAGEIRAAGICFDGRTIPPGETEERAAVCAGLEHESGEAIDVFMPYSDAGGEIVFEELFVTVRTRQFFVDGGKA